MFSIVLYRPEQPGNAGNIIRLCANCGAPLHILGPLPFFLDDRRMIRAGLDYHEIANMTYHTSFKAFMAEVKPRRLIAATTKGNIRPSDFKFAPDDFIILGRESAGLDDEVLEYIPQEQRLCIPMVPESRCLNLANAAAVMAYEAWRAPRLKLRPEGPAALPVMAAGPCS